MGIQLWLALGGGVVGAVLAGLAWYFHREMAAARVERDRAVADLTQAKVAAHDESSRHTSVLSRVGAFADAYQDGVEDMVRRHPECAGEYRDLVLRIASATGATDASVPVATAAAGSGPTRH